MREQRESHIKTRLQSQTPGAPDAYKGIADVVRKVSAKEGITALYKG